LERLYGVNTFVFQCCEMGGGYRERGGTWSGKNRGDTTNSYHIIKNTLCPSIRQADEPALRFVKVPIRPRCVGIQFSESAFNSFQASLLSKQEMYTKEDVFQTSLRSILFPPSLLEVPTP